MDKYRKQDLKTLAAILRPIEAEWREWDKAGELNWFDKNLAINTAVFLRVMAAKALSVQFVEFYGENREERLAALFGEDYEQDNTYNYNEPYSRDMVVVKRKAHDNDEGEAFTIAFAPHYGGDVRGNYGDFVVLTFANYWDFVEAHEQTIGERVGVLEIDGVEYRLHWSGAGENFVLENDEGFYEDGVNIGETEKADIIKEIKEKYL